jgi:hypothetical protein
VDLGGGAEHVVDSRPLVFIEEVQVVDEDEARAGAGEVAEKVLGLIIEAERSAQCEPSAWNGSAWAQDKSRTFGSNDASEVLQQSGFSDASIAPDLDVAGLVKCGADLVDTFLPSQRNACDDIFDVGQRCL